MNERLQFGPAISAIQIFCCGATKNPVDSRVLKLPIFEK
jgi:hypothetical protein